MKLAAIPSLGVLSLGCLLLPNRTSANPGGGGGPPGGNNNGGGRPTDPPTSSPTQAPTLSPTPTPTSSPTHSPTPTPTSSPTDSPTSAPTVSVEACASLTSIVWIRDDGVDCAPPCCEEGGPGGDDDAGTFTWPYTVHIEEKIRIQSSASVIEKLRFPLLETAGFVAISYNANLRTVSLPNLEHANSIQVIKNIVLEGLSLPSLTEISTGEDDAVNGDVDFKVTQNTALASLNVPKLSAIRAGVDGYTTNLFIEYNDALEAFTFNTLGTVSAIEGEANVFVWNNAVLREFAFPQLRSIVGYYGALLVSDNDALTSFEFPLLSEVGAPDTYSEFSVSGNAVLEVVEMPALRTVDYVFFSATPSLVDVRLPKWLGGGEESYLDFYGTENCPDTKEAMVIRLCSLQGLESGITFYVGDCYQIKGSSYAEGQCEADDACTVFSGVPNNCV